MGRAGVATDTNVCHLPALGGAYLARIASQASTGYGSAVARVVGLTGGIGCGKSVVASMLAELGASIVDADQLAREAVAVGSPALEAIRARFGDVFDDRGALDRGRLGDIVFGDDRARADLNAIVHPRVAALAMERMAALMGEGAKLIVYDVPLLYESGLDRTLPEVIVVFAPPRIQRSRVAARDGLTADQIDARIAAQMPIADKVARATHVIDNSDTLDRTRDQVQALWSQLTDGDHS